jgi:hypothetical protein
MNVIDFSFFSAEDHYDLKFSHKICWSRIYEYPFVLDEIKKTNIDNPKIHNASWGFQDIHLVFKTWLDCKYNVVHSDIRNSTFYNTEFWDITKKSKYSEEFDIIINVSTIEEVTNFSHVEIINNHLNQLKFGGFLILTFDYPGADLDLIEEFAGKKIEKRPVQLNPKNSALPDLTLGLPENFNVGKMVIQK